MSFFSGCKSIHFRVVRLHRTGDLIPGDYFPSNTRLASYDSIRMFVWSASCSLFNILSITTENMSKSQPFESNAQITAT